MRNFTNTLLFESALDSITTFNPLLYNTAYSLLNPRVTIVEEDCETLLGTSADLSTKTRGLIELDTGVAITQARLGVISAAGATEVRVRSSYTCISKGGICKACLLGSRPRLTPPSVGEVIQLMPELLVSSIDIIVAIGSSTSTLPYDTIEYDIVYVYNDGSLLPTSSYSISGTTLTLVSPVSTSTTLLCKFFVVSNVAYYYWLTKTYSGSLLGIKRLIEPPLPVKSSIMSSLVNSSDIEAIRLQLVSNQDVSEEDFIQYIPSIKDPLEKAIFVLTLGAIFLNS